MRRGSAAQAIIAFTVAGSALTACSPSGPETPPEPPAVWAGSSMSMYAPENALEGTLRIDPGGEAYLAHIPNGHWTHTSRGVCWDQENTRYTGSGTWRWFSSSGIEVTFGDSSAVFWAWPGKFGSYDWSEFKMMGCDPSDAPWGMHLICGSAGTEHLGECVKP